MSNSWEELIGENDPDRAVDEEDYLPQEDDANASVARDIYHVEDSDDALTSDDEYLEARANLRAYGESRKRKVKARQLANGEEVEQLDDFEELSSESEEEGGDEAANVNEGNVNQEEEGIDAGNDGTNPSLSNQHPSRPEQDRPE
ncbi:unnamed protein product, partial [Linum tenue]